MVKVNLLENLKQDLESVVIRAGSAIMEVYEKDFEFNKKSDGSPVTEADKLSENIIIPALKDLCPDIPIISEENSESHKIQATETFFLVDPLDGTKEFIKKNGEFTVNIALIENILISMIVVTLILDIILKLETHETYLRPDLWFINRLKSM